MSLNLFPLRLRCVRFTSRSARTSRPPDILLSLSSNCRDTKKSCESKNQTEIYIFFKNLVISQLYIITSLVSFTFRALTGQKERHVKPSNCVTVEAKHKASQPSAAPKSKQSIPEAAVHRLRNRNSPITNQPIKFESPFRNYKEKTCWKRN